jgi:hypothetical protein
MDSQDMEFCGHGFWSHCLGAWTGMESLVYIDVFVAVIVINPFYSLQILCLRALHD